MSRTVCPTIPGSDPLSCIHGRRLSSGACREQKWASDTLRRYSMTSDHYYRMLDEQSGVCALCGKPPKGNRLSVDHDHDHCPGKRSCGLCVRALLCVGCNAKQRRSNELRQSLGYDEEWKATIRERESDVSQGAYDLSFSMLIGREYGREESDKVALASYTRMLDELS